MKSKYVSNFSQELKYELRKCAEEYKDRTYCTGQTIVSSLCEAAAEYISEEDIYLKRYETMKDLKTGINAYFNFYNTARFHQSLDYNVPDEMYKCFQYNELECKPAA